MFSTNRCTPFFCFLNQREGLVANRDNIAKNSADISTIIKNINSGISKIKSLDKNISKHAAMITVNHNEYKLLPERSAKAQEELEKEIADNED